MSTLTLRAGQNPERAEAALHERLRRERDRLVVRVHGFPARALGTILGRLPAGWEVGARTSDRVVIVREGLADSPKTLRVMTANLAWQLGHRQDAHDLDELAAAGDVLLLQELNETRLSDFLDGDDWRIRQAAEGNGREMASVASRTTLRGLGHGLELGWKHRPGVKMNTRWIAWQDLGLDGRRARFASVHFPPPRFRGQWAVYAANVVGLVNRNPTVPTVIGGDFNARAGDLRMRALAAATGSRIVDTTGHGIDLFLVPRQLRVVGRSHVSDRATESDHPFGGVELGWTR